MAGPSNPHTGHRAPFAAPHPRQRHPERPPGWNKERTATFEEQLEEIQNTADGRKMIREMGPLKILNQDENVLIAMQQQRTCDGPGCNNPKGRIICTCSQCFCEKCWAVRQKQFTNEGCPLTVDPPTPAPVPPGPPPPLGPGTGEKTPDNEPTDPTAHPANNLPVKHPPKQVGPLGYTFCRWCRTANPDHAGRDCLQNKAEQERRQKG